jgi:FAD/FMN-containing dehydrogenase
MLDESALNALSRSFRGQLVHPTNVGYEAARRVWARTIDRRPALIARCHDADDVAMAVNFGRDRHLAVAIRSGGHSSFGTCDGGLIIDLSMMKGVQLDQQNRVVNVEAGLTSGELDAATLLYGLATPLGECPSTGIGGVTLGGGIGYLLGRHGLTCDNLIRAELVDANGERRIASAEDDPDLLWALRGGGGNFGVVTSLSYRLHTVGEVLAGFLTYPVSLATQVLCRVGEFAGGAPDELALIVMDDRRLTPTHALCILVCWSGDLREGEHVIRRIRAFAPSQSDSIRRLPYLEFQRLLDAPPLEVSAVGEMDFISGIDARTAEALAACIEKAPSVGCGVTLELLHGAACRVGVAETAFSVRRPGFFAYIMSAADDNTPLEHARTWVETVRSALGPVSTGDVYVNGLGMLATPDESRVRLGHGLNYARLRGLKKKHDPTNLFRLNPNIVPAG